MILDQVLFVACWDTSDSLTEVSVKLCRAGHPEMTPKRVRQMAWALRKLGVSLKEIPRPHIETSVEPPLDSVNLQEYVRGLLRKHLEGGDSRVA